MYNNNEIPHKKHGNMEIAEKNGLRIEAMQIRNKTSLLN